MVALSPFPAPEAAALLQDIFRATMHMELGWALPPYTHFNDPDTTIRHALWEAPHNSMTQLDGMQPGQLICLYSQMGYANVLYRTRRPDGLLLKLGPFLPAAPTEDYITQVIAQAKLPQHLRQTLLSQYRRLPVLPEAQVLSALQAVLRPWGEAVNPDKVTRLNFLRDNPQRRLKDLTAAYDLSAAWSEAMYQLRAELLGHIAQGHTPEALRTLTRYSPYLGLDTCTTTQELHRLLVILNTLAESAMAGTGIHPLYRRGTFLQLQEAILTQQDPMALQRYAAVIVRQYCTLAQNHGSAGHSAMVQAAIQYITLRQNEAVTLDDVARALGKSKSYLANQFKKETRLTVTQYIHAHKMDAAAMLLTTTNDTIQAVSLRVGIPNQGYFTRLFQEHFKTTPQQYRKNRSFL